MAMFKYETTGSRLRYRNRALMIQPTSASASARSVAVRPSRRGIAAGSRNVNPAGRVLVSPGPRPMTVTSTVPG
jgi:hypothetical protein